MQRDAINPNSDSQDSFSDKGPIEPFEESLEPSIPFAFSKGRVKEDLLFFLEEFQFVVKNISTLDRAEEKLWVERFSELRKEVSNFSFGVEMGKQLEHLEREFEKLKSHPYARLQQSLLEEIEQLQKSLKK